MGMDWPLASHPGISLSVILRLDRRIHILSEIRRWGWIGLWPPIPGREGQDRRGGDGRAFRPGISKDAPHHQPTAGAGSSLVIYPLRQLIKKGAFRLLFHSLAEGGRFELPDLVKGQQFSRLSRSTALPPLRILSSLQ